MTEISRPWPGTTVGDAGPYSADQWAELYRSLIHASDADAGAFIGSGVAPNAGLVVTQTAVASMNVLVRAGTGLSHGTWYKTDADVTIAITANASGNPRIDTIVLRKDWATQTVRLVYLVGTPAVTPVPPTLTQVDGVTWETPLADIAVANAAASINNLNITQRETGAGVPGNIYIPNIQNRTGVTLQTGDVVHWDGNNDNAVVTLAGVNAASYAVAGIWVGRTANLGYGKLLTKGQGWVNADSAVARRRLLAASLTTARRATPIAFETLGDFAGAELYGTMNAFAVALRSTSSAGPVWCSVDIPMLRRAAASALLLDNGANFTTASAAFVAIGAGAVNRVITPSAGTHLFIGLSANMEHSVAGALTHFDFQITTASIGTQRVGAAFANGLKTARGLGAGLTVPVEVSALIKRVDFGIPLEPFTIEALWRTTAATASIYSGAGGATNDVPINMWVYEVG